MTEYYTMTEEHLQHLLLHCSSFQERRLIRGVIRELRQAGEDHHATSTDNEHQLDPTPHCPESTSRSPSSTSSSDMLSLSPKLPHSFGPGAQTGRGTVGSLRHHSTSDSVVARPSSSPLFKVAPDRTSSNRRGSSSLLKAGDVCSNRDSASSRERWRASTSSLDKPKTSSRSGRGSVPNLRNKRPSEALSYCLLPLAEESDSPPSSPFSSSTTTITPSADFPHRINIRRSSHVFLSDGGEQNPPPLLSPCKKSDDDVFLDAGSDTYSVMKTAGAKNSILSPAGNLYAGSTFGAGRTNSGASFGAGRTNSGTSFGAGRTNTGTSFSAGGTNTGTNFGAGSTKTGTNFSAGSTKTGTTISAGSTNTGTSFGTGSTKTHTSFSAGGTNTETTFGASGTNARTSIGAGSTKTGTSFSAGGTSTGTNFGASNTDIGTSFGAAKTGTSSSTNFGTRLSNRGGTGVGTSISNNTGTGINSSNSMGTGMNTSNRSNTGTGINSSGNSTGTGLSSTKSPGILDSSARSNANPEYPSSTFTRPTPRNSLTNNAATRRSDTGSESYTDASEDAHKTGNIFGTRHSMDKKLGVSSTNGGTGNKTSGTGNLGYTSSTIPTNTKPGTESTNTTGYNSRTIRNASTGFSSDAGIGKTWAGLGSSRNSSTGTGNSSSSITENSSINSSTGTGQSNISSGTGTGQSNISSGTGTGQSNISSGTGTGQSNISSGTGRSNSTTPQTGNNTLSSFRIKTNKSEGTASSDNRITGIGNTSNTIGNTNNTIGNTSNTSNTIGSTSNTIGSTSNLGTSPSNPTSIKNFKPITSNSSLGTETRNNNRNKLGIGRSKSNVTELGKSSNSTELKNKSIGTETEQKWKSAEKEHKWKSAEMERLKSNRTEAETNSSNRRGIRQSSSMGIQSSSSITLPNTRSSSSSMGTGNSSMGTGNSSMGTGNSSSMAIQSSSNITLPNTRSSSSMGTGNSSMGTGNSSSMGIQSSSNITIPNTRSSSSSMGTGSSSLGTGNSSSMGTGNSSSTGIQSSSNITLPNTRSSSSSSMGTGNSSMGTGNSSSLGIGSRSISTGRDSGKLAMNGTRMAPAVTDKGEQSYVDQCKDEDELLDLLCTTEDIKERLRIRTRLRQLKEAREGAGNSEASKESTASSTSLRDDLAPSPSASNTPTTPLTSSSSVSSSSSRFSSSAADRQRSTTTTPGSELAVPRHSDRVRVGDSGDRDVTSSKGEHSVGWEDLVKKRAAERKGVKGGEVDYDAIEDIEELRQLLNGALEFDEKWKIRVAIRKLRRKVESADTTQTQTTAATRPSEDRSLKDKDARATRAYGSNNNKGSQVTDTRSSSLLNSAGERRLSTDRETGKSPSSITRSGKLLENQAKVGSSSDSVLKSREGRSSGSQNRSQDQDSVTAVAYTPFERRSSLRAGHDKDLSVLVRDKVKAALKGKLHTVTPISAWTTTTTSTRTDTSVSSRPDSQADDEHHLTALVSEKVQEALKDRLQTSPSTHALSLSQDRVKSGILASEAEKRQQDEQLSELVKEKVQEVLNSKFPTAQGEAKPTDKTSLNHESSESSVSYTKRPQGISGYKSWEDSLRSSNTHKPSTLSSDRSFRGEDRRRNSIDRKSDLQKLNHVDDPGKSKESGLRDRSRQGEDREGPDSGREFTSSIKKERSQLRRPSSPLISQSVHTAADTKPSGQSITSTRRPSNPRLRRPSSPSLTCVQPVERPASPISSQYRRRGSSPFLSDGHLLDKAQSGPLQSSLSPRNRRPSSPLLSESNRRSSLTFQSLSSSSSIDEPATLLSDVKPIIKDQTRAADEADKHPRASKLWEDDLNWDVLHTVKARLQARRSSLRSEDQNKAHPEPQTDPKSTTNEAVELKNQKNKENTRLSKTGVSETKPDDRAVTTKELETASRKTNENEPKHKDWRKISSETSLNKNNSHTNEIVPETKTRSAKPLSAFDKLDRGQKPSVPKGLVSSLTDRFSTTETASPQLKVFAVASNKTNSPVENAPPQSNSLKKTESLRVSQKGENAERGQGGRVPSRAESLTTQDIQRKPTGLKKEVTFAGDRGEKDAGKPDREPEPRTTGKPLTPKSDLSQSTDLQTDSKLGRKDSDTSSRRETTQGEEATSQVKSSGPSPAVKMTKDDPEVALMSAPSADKPQGEGSGSSTMENAFSALLDDIEVKSASEGTASDLDLSDGDETLAEKSASKGQGQSPKTNLDTTTGVNHTRNADVKINESGSSATVKRSNSLTRGNKSVGLSPLVEDGEDKHSDKEGGQLLDRKKTVKETDDDEVFDQADGANLQRMKPNIQPESPNFEIPTLTIETCDDSTDIPPPPSQHSEDHPPPPPTRDSKLDNASTPADTKPLETFIPQNTPKIQTPDDQNPQNQPPTEQSDSERSMVVVKDDDGGTIYRKISRDEQENRVYTVKSKLRRTSSDASEELRDTILETNFLAPGGAAIVQERDVIRSRRKITPGGSDYYVRTTQRTRRVHDVGGSDFVEQDVTVERDNTSVKEGRSWGSKTVTKVTLDADADPGDLPLDELCSLPQLELGGRRSGSASIPPPGKMDLSKASSGYGSVSGSEEEDKDMSPTAAVDLRPPRMVGVPEILNTLKDVTAVEGQTAVLECTLMGHPTPDVTWFFDDDEVDVSGERVTDHFDVASGKAILTFQEVLMGDKGLYTCTCKNQFGEASTKAALLVKQRPSNKPFFEEPLRDVTVVEDHSVTLQCVVTSATSVAWYKDGIVQRNSSDFRQTFDGRVARLEIGEVFMDDVGKYSCLARNEVGEERTTCTLRVTAAGSSDTEMVPTFLTRLHHKILRVGDDLQLEVEVIGNPTPEIVWRRDGVDLPDTLTTTTRYDGRVAQLRMERMAMEEEGVFECLALNSAGQACMDARVTVQKRNKPPTITVPLRDVTSPLGGSVTLQCSVTGTPTPSVFWRRNGLIVADTPDFQHSLQGGEARLTIAVLREKHGGQYECVARNEAGDAVCSCLLSVLSPSEDADQHQKPQPKTESASLQETTDLTPDKTPETNPTRFTRRNRTTLDLTTSASKRLNTSSSGEDSAPLREVFNNQRPSKSQDISDEVSPVTKASAESSIVSKDVFSYVETDTDNLDISAKDRLVSKREQINDKETDTDQDRTTDKPEQITARDEDKQTTSTDRDKQTGSKKEELQQVADNTETKGVPGSENDSQSVSDMDATVEASVSVSVPESSSVSVPDEKSSARSARARTTLRQQSSEDQTDSVVRKFSMMEKSADVPPSQTAKQGSSPRRKISEPPFPSSKRQAFGSPRSTVSQLRAQFSKLEEDSSSEKTNRGRDGGAGGGGGRGGNFRRSSSTPPREERPSVSKRAPSQLSTSDNKASPSPSTNLTPTTTTPASTSSTSSTTATTTTTTTMSSYDHIDDEEELHKMMNSTDSFEERKKIRGRLRDIREKQRAEMEARRLQREKETEDIVRRKFEMAEEEKRRKMLAFNAQKPVCERDTDYQSAAQKMIHDKHRLAEEEKQKKLEAYRNIAQREHTAQDGRTATRVTTTTVRNQDGSSSVTKKTETTTSVPQTMGFGGVQYGAPKQAADDQEASPEDETSTQGDSKTPAETEETSASKQADTLPEPDEPTEKTASPSPDSPGEASKPSSDEGTQKQATEDLNNQGSEKSTNKDTPAETPGDRDPEKPAASAEKEKEHVEEAAATAASKTEDPASPKTESSSEQGENPEQKSPTKPVPVGKTAALNSRQLREQLRNASGPATRGSVTVKTQSWSSRDGVVHKSQKTESWGAKAQGPRGAMAAFKQMDAANPAPKPNGLVTISMAKKAATTMRRNVGAIKEQILHFAKANTKDYENVEVTNFSSCWNNGMAFCALIHHFFPDAFDFSQLEPKNRRYNFNLAFDTAEKMADIMPLLDVEDMVRMKNPDWKCVFTYVQAIYRHLRDHERNAARPAAPAES